MRRPLAAAVVLVATLAAAVSPAAAWHTAGHARVAEAAVRALPSSVPAFFRAGAWPIGEAAVDPDLMKDRQVTALDALIWPEHFLDSELVQGSALPADRWAFVDLLHDKHLTVANVGLLPYAVEENVERLAMTFAEARRWPDDPAIQQRALVYAGWLAHYAGDLEQPLHTTLHHDGRALPDGSSPKTGIHFSVDSMLERAPLDVHALTRNLPVHPFADSWTAVQGELGTSHALVERVYQLEPELRAAFPPPPPAPAPPAPGATPAPRPTPAPASAVKASPPSAAVMAFASERFRTTATFIANLYLTAWERSATIQIPAWDKRAGPGNWAPGQHD